MEQKGAEVILTVGDSVDWGQGLKEEHKFDFLFAQARGLVLTRVAHSGAVIGTSNDSATEIEQGEIPVSWPSLWQQVLVQKDWSQVQIVLLNGGLNDVSLTRILNPAVQATQLAGLVNQFCNIGMQDLLLATAGKLTLPNARIAVVGYYPIFSNRSDATEMQFKSLLELHGVTSSSVIAEEEFSLDRLIPNVVENCLTFWIKSNDALQTAVDAVNRNLGGNVCRFVKLPFTEANALWAPQSLLWELTPFLLPEDEVSDPRGKLCEILYGDVVHIPRWIQCVRASVGHPNVQGAARIAEALSAAL
jgi:lysophospholipase L1-like esterase